ncbi:MAG: hypothetical protein ACLPJH_18510 [Myxococcaceae bacterium]
MDAVQDHLEAIYAVRCTHRARGFLVDAEQAQALGADTSGAEALLVLEVEGALEMGLYLAPDVLALAPSGALGPFCQLAEGVSHFVYLARSAELARCVSLLELEAQAEVDKFALLLLRAWSEGRGRWAAALHRCLFDDTSLRPGLSASEQRRYGEANRLARAFCARLLPLVAARRLEQLLQVLRYAYRLGAAAKLEHFAGS